MCVALRWLTLTTLIDKWKRKKAGGGHLALDLQRMLLLLTS